jgi:hypothetical protein
MKYRKYHFFLCSAADECSRLHRGCPG